MARALLGHVASADDLREVDNARLRARVRELQEQIELLQGEVRTLRAEVVAADERALRALSNESVDTRFDELTRQPASV